MSLKDRKRNADLYSFLNVQSVADVMRRGRLRWIGHLERKSVDDWVSACREIEVAGRDVRGGIGRPKKSVQGIEVLGLHPEWAVFRDVWRDLIQAVLDMLGNWGFNPLWCVSTPSFHCPYTKK